MWHELVLDGEFFARLRGIDEAVAAETRARGCPCCGGPLCTSDYPRKPRGALIAAAVEDDRFRERLSLCCSDEDCRRRTTPPSVIFLGRKVYAEGVIVVACIVAPLVRERAREIGQALGLAVRTVRRWLRWWRTVFTASALFVEAQARIPGLDAAALPGSLVERLEQTQPVDKLVALARWLSPLTSTEGARALRAASVRAEDGARAERPRSR